MKILFIKDFQNTPSQVIEAGCILDMWPETAERAIKEKSAVSVPDGIDEEMYKNSIINKKKK